MIRHLDRNGLVLTKGDPVSVYGWEEMRGVFTGRDEYGLVRVAWSAGGLSLERPGDLVKVAGR